MPDCIVGDLKVSWPLYFEGEVHVTETGVTFPDGSSYDRATDTTIVVSMKAHFAIYERKRGFLSSKWVRIVEIQPNGNNARARGNLNVKF